MAYSGQLEEFARLIEKLLRQGVIPAAILLSGGGNDVAGDETADAHVVILTEPRLA